MARGDKLKSAMRKDPKGGRTRVSPGVYREPSNRLVSQRGRYLQNRAANAPAQSSRPQPPSMDNLNYKYPTDTNPSDYVNAAQMLNPPPPPPTQGNAWQGNLQANTQPIQAMPYAPNNFTPERSDYWALGARPMPQAQLQGWNQSFENRFQPSANQGGRYRLSPGVYGTREQAQRQYEIESQPQPYEMYAKPNWKMS